MSINTASTRSTGLLPIGNGGLLGNDAAMDANVERKQNSEKTNSLHQS
jgi:hypothetical protein